jgi:DNA repair exonuclease SbcCD ATPase subunit
MMILNKINVYNFITYHKQTFDFNKMFAKDNIILIHGINHDDSTFANDNGAGKSLIYEIVLYLLFGKTSRNTSKNLLIGKFDKYTRIKGTLEDDYGNTYVITRYIKHPIHNNGVKFSINEDKKTKGTPTELSNLIERTLGISYRRIMNTSIFEGNDSRSRFVYLGDKEAKALLLQMKGMDIFSTCHSIANEIHKEAIKSSEKIREKLLKATWKVNEYDDRLKKYKVMSDGYEELRTKKIKEINDKIDQIKKRFDKIKTKLLNESRGKRKEIKVLKEKKPNKKAIDKGSDKLAKINSRMLVIKEKTFSLNQDVKKNNQTIKNLSAQDIGERCVHCASIIKKENVKRYLKEINDELDGLSNIRSNFNDELVGLMNSSIMIEKKINKLKSILSEINIEITDLKESIRRREDALEQNSVELRTSVKLMEAEVDELANNKNEFKKMYLDEKKKKKVALMKRQLIKKKINKQEEIERYYKAWVDGFGQEAIQNYALRSVVEELNNEILRVSEILTDGLVDIKILTEKTLANKKIKNVFELKITDLIKKKLPFKEWSKGQKKRIEIITSFALMNLEENILREIFLDEMFDGIDKVGVTKILSLLENKNNDGKRFIVFSHSEDIRQRFTNYGVVTLKNGRSKFKIGE